MDRGNSSCHTVVAVFLGLLLIMPILAACDDDDDGNMFTGNVPIVEGPITEPGTPLQLGMVSSQVLTAAEYEVNEYFIAGTAKSYRAVNALPGNGMWEVESAESAPYKVRILVQRPEDPAAFNGTVVMEWFNVSGGIEAAPDLLALHTELFRRGYAWIGVSAQYAGVEGGSAALSSQKMDLKTVDPERYGSLSHPGDSYSYDIFSQAADAIRNPGKVNPLAGYDVERILAAGESQSAYRLTTYYNAVQPHVHLFDGFLIHSRGGGAAQLGDEPMGAIDFFSVVKLRTDLDVPALILQTETDLFLLGYYESRQDDTDSIRLWEMAGTAHADLYQLGRGANDTGTDPAVADVVEIANPYPGFVECDFPVNSGPQHFIAKAAIHQLDNWVRTGIPPPTADRLEIAGEPPALVLDELGNAKGGIRTSYVDAPIAKLSGLGQPGDISEGSICTLFGTTDMFDEATLAALYLDHAAYITAVENSTNAAVQAGFLMLEDGELIKAAAATYDPATPSG